RPKRSGVADKRPVETGISFGTDRLSIGLYRNGQMAGRFRLPDIDQLGRFRAGRLYSLVHCFAYGQSPGIQGRKGQSGKDPSCRIKGYSNRWVAGWNCFQECQNSWYAGKGSSCVPANVPETHFPWKSHCERVFVSTSRPASCRKNRTLSGSCRTQAWKVIVS